MPVSGDKLNGRLISSNLVGFSADGTVAADFLPEINGTVTQLAVQADGKKAREGLVRACMSHEGVGFEAEKWKEVSRIYRRAMGLALGRKSGSADVEKGMARPQMNTAEALVADGNGTVLPDLGMAAMLRCRVRYFTDGAVIGSKGFVNEAFAGARERFTANRKDGARKMRGSGAPAAGELWSLRDLRVRI